MFGKGNSPGSFGHAGAYSQVAWADPATGISFSFLKNGLQADMMADAVNVIPITDAAAALR
jgi:CubicO group peptidase (beta-lactamase class C family)